jgi:hypothetical protein
LAKPRPLTVAIAAVCAGLIALLVVLLLGRDRRTTPALPEAPAMVTNPAPSERDAVDAKPALRPPAAAVSRPAARAPMKPEARTPPDEASLLAQLHDLAASDPELSLKLGREAVSRFPDSPNAPEFEWNVVKALFNMRRLEDAEAEARVMLSKYPDSSFTGDVVHHLLNHPPNPTDVP